MASNLNINISMPAESGRVSQEVAPPPMELGKGQGNIAYSVAAQGGGAPAPEPPDQLPSQFGRAPSAMPMASAVSGAAAAPVPLEPSVLASMASGASQVVSGSAPPPPMALNQHAGSSGRAVETGMAPSPSRIEDVAAAAGVALPIGLPPQPIPPEELENAARASGDSGGSRNTPQSRRGTR
jgi:hypothetical protein